MRTKPFFIFLCSIIFTICLCSVAFAGNAKDEAVDFLKQATQNTVNAQNASYSIDLSMTGPLADCNIGLNGNYAYPVFTNGDISLLLNLWIIDTSFKMQTQYFTELDGDIYKQYFKIRTDPNLKNDKSELKSDQWYVQTIIIPENFLQSYTEEVNENIDNIGKDVKNIFMYDIDKDTAKIYVTYNKPLLNKKKLNEALKVSDLNNEKINQISRELNENKKLKEALTTPHELSYEIVVDKKDMYITSVKTDLSAAISELGTDILNSISDEKLSAVNCEINGASIRNIVKNYLQRSKIIMTIHLSDFNSSSVQPVPQEIKDKAIEVPKIEKSDANFDNTNGDNADMRLKTPENND